MLTLLHAECTAGAAQLVDPRPFTYPPPDCPVGLPLAPDEAMGVMGDGPAAGPPAMTLHVGAGTTAESRPHADVGITGSPVPQAHADRLSLLLHAANSPRMRASGTGGAGSETPGGMAHGASASSAAFAHRSFAPPPADLQRPMGQSDAMSMEPEVEEGHIDVERIRRPGHAGTAHKAGVGGALRGTWPAGPSDDPIMMYEPVPVQDLADSILSDFDRSHGYHEPTAHAHAGRAMQAAHFGATTAADAGGMGAYRDAAQALTDTTTSGSISELAASGGGAVLPAGVLHAPPLAPHAIALGGSAEDAAWAAEAALALLLLGSPSGSSQSQSGQVPHAAHDAGHVGSQHRAGAARAAVSAANQPRADADMAMHGTAAAGQAAAAAGTPTTASSGGAEGGGANERPAGQHTPAKRALHGMLPEPSAVPHPIYHKPQRRSVDGHLGMHAGGGPDAHADEDVTSAPSGASWPGPAAAMGPAYTTPGLQAATGSGGALGSTYLSLPGAHTSLAASAVPMPGAHGYAHGSPHAAMPTHLGPVSTAGSRPGPLVRQACGALNGGAVVAVGTPGFEDTSVGMCGVAYDSAATELAEEDRDMVY